MTTVYISLGSNIDREKYIRAGIKALNDHFGHLTLSNVYESATIGFDGDPFLNLVAAFETDIEPKQVDLILDDIEKANGRTPRQKKFSSRRLDLDLILFGDYISEGPDLNVPRDEIIECAFVLEPLAEIAGDLRHPIVKKTYSEMWLTFDKSNLIQKTIEFDFNQ